MNLQDLTVLRSMLAEFHKFTPSERFRELTPNGSAGKSGLNKMPIEDQRENLEKIYKLLNDEDFKRHLYCDLDLIPALIKERDERVINLQIEKKNQLPFIAYFNNEVLKNIENFYKMLNYILDMEYGNLYHNEFKNRLRLCYSFSQYYKEFSTELSTPIIMEPELNSQILATQNSINFYKKIATALYCFNYKIGGDDYGNFKSFIEAKHNISFTKGEIFYSNLINAMPIFGEQIADIAKGEIPSYKEKIFKEVLAYCKSRLSDYNEHVIFEQGLQADVPISKDKNQDPVLNPLPPQLPADLPVPIGTDFKDLFINHSLIPEFLNLLMDEGILNSSYQFIGRQKKWVIIAWIRALDFHSMFKIRPSDIEIKNIVQDNFNVEVSTQTIRGIFKPHQEDMKQTFIQAIRAISPTKG